MNSLREAYEQYENELRQARKARMPKDILFEAYLDGLQAGVVWATNRQERINKELEYVKD